MTYSRYSRLARHFRNRICVDGCSTLIKGESYNRIYYTAMGNNLGKTIQKKEVLTKLSSTQRTYVEAWYCTLCDEQTQMIAQSEFVKDVKKKFANIPEPIVTALCECMNPDSKYNIKEDAFFYMAYIILNGSFEERVRLSYTIIQNLGNDSEVTFGSLLHFFKLVNSNWNEDDAWSEKRICDLLKVTPDSNTILSWKDFYTFCSDNPKCPIVSWMQQLCKSIEDSCILFQKLVDSQGSENQRMSKMYYYTTKKTIIYNHIHEMSVTVLLDIYGTLMRSGNGGYITKTQWYTEMAKFFPQQLVQKCFSSSPLTPSIFWDFSEEDSISVSVVVSAMCLLCHDSLDRRISASLFVFNNTTRSNGKFTHADLVKLFSLGVKMFDVDNSFDCVPDETDETDDIHIRMKRRLSQDDESHFSVVPSLRPKE